MLRISNAPIAFILTRTKKLLLGVRLPEFDETFPKGLLVLSCGMVLCDLLPDIIGIEQANTRQ